MGTSRDGHSFTRRLLKAAVMWVVLGTLEVEPGTAYFCKLYCLTFGLEHLHLPAWP